MPRTSKPRWAAAARAAREWRRRPLAERAALLRNMAVQLRQNSDRLTRMITLEMGKPLAEARGEIEKSAWNCEYVAEHGASWLADEEVVTQARRSYVAYRPLGPIPCHPAVEFPGVAGLPLRDLRADGRQCVPAEGTRRTCRAARNW